MDSDECTEDFNESGSFAMVLRSRLKAALPVFKKPNDLFRKKSNPRQSEGWQSEISKLPNVCSTPYKALGRDPFKSFCSMNESSLNNETTSKETPMKECVIKLEKIDVIPLQPNHLLNNVSIQTSVQSTVTPKSLRKKPLVANCSVQTTLENKKSLIEISDHVSSENKDCSLEELLPYFLSEQFNNELNNVFRIHSPSLFKISPIKPQTNKQLTSNKGLESNDLLENCQLSTVQSTPPNCNKIEKENSSNHSLDMRASNSNEDRTTNESSIGLRRSKRISKLGIVHTYSQVKKNKKELSSVPAKGVLETNVTNSQVPTKSPQAPKVNHTVISLSNSEKGIEEDNNNELHAHSRLPTDHNVETTSNVSVKNKSRVSHIHKKVNPSSTTCQGIEKDSIVASEILGNNCLFSEINGKVLPIEWFYKNLNNLNQPDNIGFQYCLKGIQSPIGCFTTGALTLAPVCKKPRARFERHICIFTVVKGTAIVRVQRIEKVATEGCQFYIPMKTSYIIMNGSSTDYLKLSFIKISKLI